jgi:hypothetical protein
MYIMVSLILIYRTDRGLPGVRCPYVQCPLPLTGAGNVAIVYRDELGQRVTATQPVYVDTRLLESGLGD